MHHLVAMQIDTIKNQLFSFYVTYSHEIILIADDYIFVQICIEKHFSKCIMVKLSRILYVYLVQYPPFVIFNLLQRLLYLISPGNMKTPGSKGITSDWLASNRFLTTINRIMKVQADRETELNGPFIDVNLFHLQTKTEVSLLNFIKDDR